MTFTLTTRRPDLSPEPARTFRNPIIFARELKAEMEAEGLTQTELAKNMGVTRARISQWLSLLRLPADLIADVESLGDHWSRRLVTERHLREADSMTLNTSGDSYRLKQHRKYGIPPGDRLGK